MIGIVVRDVIIPSAYKSTELFPECNLILNEDPEVVRAFTLVSNCRRSPVTGAGQVIEENRSILVRFVNTEEESVPG